MIATIIQILQSIAAPLSPDIFLSSIFAGIVFGILYNYRLNLPDTYIYHKWIAGLSFITTMALFRFGAIALGVSIGFINPLGWIGIAFLWTTFCANSLLGVTLSREVGFYLRARNQKKVKEKETQKMIERSEEHLADKE